MIINVISNIHWDISKLNVFSSTGMFIAFGRTSVNRTNNINITIYIYSICIYTYNIYRFITPTNLEIQFVFLNTDFESKIIDFHSIPVFHISVYRHLTYIHVNSFNIYTLYIYIYINISTYYQYSMLRLIPSTIFFLLLFNKLFKF